MERRRFLAGAGALSVARPAIAEVLPRLPIPPTGQMGFNVFRNGVKIGEHHLDFSGDGGNLTVNVEMQLLVRLAGIPIYTYAGTATERWAGGVFESLDSAVNNNGTQLEVHAHRIFAGYDVVGVNRTNPAKSYPEYTAPPNTLPLTYWNKAWLKGTALNIQTAHSYPPIVSSPGWNYLTAAGGETILAQRFDVTGKLHLSIWYDQQDQWSGLQFQYLGDISYQKILP